MDPVMQTQFWDPKAPPEKQRGNCLTAVVASLLELPIEAVPNFVQDHVDTDGVKDWWHEMHAFVAEHGHEFKYIRVSPESSWPEPEPGEFYTVTGVSPRDPAIHHIVIYRDGKMVHDPHPDGTGIAVMDAEYHWTLRPTSEVD